jgi:outer membrane protein W
VSGLNAYIRYYPIHAKRFNVFGELSSGFGSLNIGKSTTDRIYGDYSLYSISVGVGVNYFLNKKLAIQLLIPYLKTYQLSDTSLLGSQTFTFSTLAPTIGLQYYISPK